MSFNQSRSDRSETQYRKSNRSASSNQQRNFSGVHGKGAGAGPAPSPSVNSNSSHNSNRSFKKSNNAQGGQGRRNVAAVETGNAAAPRNVQNGGHGAPQIHGTSDAAVTSNVPKPTEPNTTQRSTRAVPKVPTSQSTVVKSETTPVKAPDVAKAFPFQFGSISPGFMNGMQVPARTSSAPPNLDEQKRDQGREDSLKSIPSLPTPAPKQQLARKDADQPGEGHQAINTKKSVSVSPAFPASQTPKSSVLPVPMTSMQIPFHPAQASVQFGAPNLHMQPQSMAPTSLQMPMSMPLPVGNPQQVQQQLFVPGLQSHPMAPQNIMHQGPGMGFTTPMGPHIPPQLSHMGLGMTPQYPQQGGKFGGPRKTTVKITHPDTHEELRLDKRKDAYSGSGGPSSRSHSSMPPSQPVPSYSTSHPISYYPNSYGPGPIFFPPSSVPLTSGQIPPSSHAPRFNYPVNQGSHNMSFVNPAAHSSVPVNKATLLAYGVQDSSKVEHISHNASSSAPSAAVQVTVKPATVCASEKVSVSLPSTSPATEKVESPKPLRASGEANSSVPQRDVKASVESNSSQQMKSGSESLETVSLSGATKQPVTVSVPTSSENSVPDPVSYVSPAHSEDLIPAVINSESRSKGNLSRSNSIKDHQKKTSKKGQNQPQIQFGGQFTSQPSSSAASEIMHAKNVSTPLLSDLPRESVSTVVTSHCEESHSKENIVKASVSIPSKISSSETSLGTTVDTASCTQLNDFSVPIEVKREPAVHKEQGQKLFTGNSIHDGNSSEATFDETRKISNLDETTVSNEITATGVVQSGLDVSTSDSVDGKRCSDTSNSKENEVPVLKSVAAEQHIHNVTPDPSEAILKHEDESVEITSGGLASISKEKSIIEQNNAKNITAKGKKKRKEILQKADAAGTTSDLYMAYKGPEEKKEVAVPTESIQNISAGVILKQASADDIQGDDAGGEKVVPIKAEPDDWEDAAETSSLEASKNADPTHGGLLQNEQGNENMTKKYSRDFLLIFSEQCMDLPDGFEIAPETAEALMSGNVNASHLVGRDSYSSSGRTVDRSGGGSRVDRRGNGMGDDERWNKTSGSFGPGRDMRLDPGYGNMGFRPGQGGNFGVLRNPRAQMPMQYTGGILSGSMQSMGSPGGMGRNHDERWQRTGNFQQRGLIPSPHTPMQIMHKAERKYEVGKVTDEEQAKQRQLKAILNKLTPQNFDKLFEQVKEVNIDNAVTLTGVISQIFDKALMEPTFCEMYANFCHHLAGELPDFSEDNEKITFKRLLLNKCQEEFERGEREQEEANKVEEEGEVKQSEEEREEKRIKARRRMLGNIRLIGELYKKKMLTERIMHECIKKLLGQYQNPDEEDIESLCKLMSTIGEMIDHPKAKEHMDAYFDRMSKLSNNMKLSSRVRFMLKDSIDLRKNKWQQRRKVEGPKKIDEVHRDAAQERQTQASRLARGPSMNSSPRRGPMDFGPRGSTMSSSQNSQMGGYRGMPSPVRGFGGQDFRFEERQPYEARTLSVPLPHRSPNDDSITLGPQGGLGRGMSIRGPPVISNTPLADVSSSGVDSRRMNGIVPVPDRSGHRPGEDIVQRFAPDPSAYDQSNAPYVNRNIRNSDRASDRPIATPSPARGQGQSFAQNPPIEKAVPEERLRDMSMAAIKEFYSARDEKEVALCVKDLNSPSFHSTMISLWVTDSFERKDMERDLLTKLIINLAKSKDCVFNQGQLVKGFESVLTTLEDAVNDAPKAAEFLGRMFGKVVVENVVPLKEIGRLIHEGGEEPGELVKFGLAGDVLGSTLQLIKAEKGEAGLKEIRTSSNVRVEDFRPLEPNRSRILENFL